MLGLLGLAAHPLPANGFRIALALALYGILLEGGQAFIPGRDPSLADALANLSGAVLGVAVYGLWNKFWGAVKT